MIRKKKKNSRLTLNSDGKIKIQIFNPRWTKKNRKKKIYRNVDSQPNFIPKNENIKPNRVE